MGDTGINYPAGASNHRPKMPTNMATKFWSRDVHIGTLIPDPVKAVLLILTGMIGNSIIPHRQLIDLIKTTVQLTSIGLKFKGIPLKKRQKI